MGSEETTIEETPEQKEAARLERQRDDDLKYIASTPQGARKMLEEINSVIFELDPHTGNAGTYYNLGIRQTTINELDALLRVLEIETYTDLVVYLTGISTKQGD